MSVPCSRITPIIVAAMPIVEKNSAEQLFSMLKLILDGLIDRGIHVVSYASDGTDVERQVSEMLFTLGERRGYTIPNQLSHLGEEDDTFIEYAVYRGKPICVIQDSKHGLKTMRNNLFSGARLLVLGNHVAAYRRIRDMANASDSPLPERDVNEKLDRQDDAAASRLFSAATLNYLVENHREESLGEIVFLFVFGELIDAYQNRVMTHLQRIHLALRARYFIAHWNAFLTVSGYPIGRYHVSRPALDILNVLVNGLIALIIVHRDHLNGEVPLLPWLCSTEPCEHVFGSARQVVKDFTYLDFVYMIPKLRVKLREAVLHSHTGDPKARASGYNHTYFDNAGVDYAVLKLFPSDKDIRKVAKIAADEVKKLMALVGIDARQLGLLACMSGRDRVNESDIEATDSDDSDSDAATCEDNSPSAQPVALPSISKWFPYETFEELGLTSSEENLADGEGGIQLRNFIQTDYATQSNLSLSLREEREISGLSCAGIASLAQDTMNV